MFSDKKKKPTTKTAYICKGIHLSLKSLSLQLLMWTNAEDRDLLTHAVSLQSK